MDLSICPRETTDFRKKHCAALGTPPCISKLWWVLNQVPRPHRRESDLMFQARTAPQPNKKHMTSLQTKHKNKTPAVLCRAQFVSKCQCEAHKWVAFLCPFQPASGRIDGLQALSGGSSWASQARLTRSAAFGTWDFELGKKQSGGGGGGGGRW